MSVQTPMTELKEGEATSTGDSELGALSDDQIPEFNYVTGWREHAILTGIVLGLLFIHLEVTIVATSLVAITDDLGGFGQSSWIFTAYLITYITGLIIWAKLSDFIGRKSASVASLVLFTAFSGACGGAQTMNQLIVFRAFQGAGGSGIYALSLLLLYELGPKRKIPIYTAITTVAITLALAIGPIIGGVIADRASWRWVFLLNVPAGAVTGIVIILAVPRDFPHQGQAHAVPGPGSSVLRAVDFTGALLMLVAIALLITGLEEASTLLSWVEKTVLAPICVAAVVWVAFFLHQRWTTRRQDSGVSLSEPVFPWRFCENRIILGLIISSFMTGAVSNTCIFLLPIRHQTAAGLSAIDAGIRLIPLTAGGPIGAVLGSVLSRNKRVPPLYFAFLGQIMMIMGTVFLSRQDTTGTGSGPSDNQTNWSGIYGLELIVGLGYGFAIATSTVLTPYLVEKRDLAVGTAAPVQFRFLGSAIVIAITTAAGNSKIRDQLLGTLTLGQIQAIFRSSKEINGLPADVQQVVRYYFAEAFGLQMEITLGFAVAGVFASLMMWQRVQARVE
ncbi:putative multidrug resistance protein fnx1 [Bombardia bombarda]|uniref:Multidrug resistance protein fnx1 n=1 Tax=Bombardia bombarda TaxID=252184 RepID=A0AA39X186_9PEZI|nr:putative multidrug resistance protein fnx1 [Bombardia bombarda]